MSHRSPFLRSGLLVLACVSALAACSDADKKDSQAATPSTDPAATVPAGSGQGAAPLATDPATMSPIEKLMAMLDADHDGRISRDEHLASVHGMFGRMDSDRDGYVTVEEMDEIRRNIHGEDRSSSQAELSKVDGDGDGRLSAEEHAKSTQVEFERMDRDHDGYLTVPELEAVQSGL